MPNILAYTMLLAWPIVTLLLFRHLPPARALVWTVLAGYLVLPPLPAAFDFPLLPPLNKEILPNLSAFIVCLLVLPKFPSLFPQSALARFLIAAFVLTPAATVMVNGEAITFVGEKLPGLRVFDALAMMINQFILLLGFLLARILLQTKEAQRDILVAFVLAGLVYSVPMFIEIRLSPQLNLWIYGYYQHLFEQSIRGDSFRPLVFLFHGIWAAFFTMGTVVAGFALARQNATFVRQRYLISALYLVVLLILCRTLGALIYAIALVPLVIFAGNKTQIRIATVLAVLALLYPTLKSANLVPTNAMLAAAEKISPERAHSLKFRFDNEDLLRKRASEKPLFGWGSWGRNHEHNPIDGTITTVSDGRWIITLGVFGWVGFLAEFGLLGLPIFLLWREVRHLTDAKISPYVGPLVLLLAVNLVDLIPNATLTPLSWLLSGALLGHAELLARKRANKEKDLPVRAPRRTVI